MKDNFNGGNAKLVDSIKALLDLDASGSLVPHGVGGHARTMLEAAAVRLNVPAEESVSLETRYIQAARKVGCLAELCSFSEYDPDVGRVPEHWKPRFMSFARALVGSTAQICEQVAAQSNNHLFRSGAKICAGEIRRAAAQPAQSDADVETKARANFEVFAVEKFLPPLERSERFPTHYKDDLTSHLWTAYRDGYKQATVDAAPQSCDLASEGWHCSREKGHQGPCAAHPDDCDDNDVVARTKRILAMVDTYHARPDSMSRSALRHYLMDEFRELLTTPKDPDELASKVGKLIEGLEVSMDVSTGESDAQNRIFGKVSEVMVYDRALHILAIEESRNFEEGKPA
jgi:hypothetical protein